MRFRPNPRLAAELARQPEMRRTLAELAEPAKDQANLIVRLIGPRGWMPRHRGDPVQIRTEDGEVRLVNTDYAAHLQEFGSVNNPPHAPLRRGVRAAGLRLDEE